MGSQVSTSIDDEWTEFPARVRRITLGLLMNDWICAVDLTDALDKCKTREEWTDYLKNTYRPARTRIRNRIARYVASGEWEEADLSRGIKVDQIH